jgi:hypothetical protein
LPRREMRAGLWIDVPESNARGTSPEWATHWRAFMSSGRTASSPRMWRSLALAIPRVEIRCRAHLLQMIGVNHAVSKPRAAAMRRTSLGETPVGSTIDGNSGNGRSDGGCGKTHVGAPFLEQHAASIEIAAVLVTPAARRRPR